MTVLDYHDRSKHSLERYAPQSRLSRLGQSAGPVPQLPGRAKWPSW
jgi:hypothetical protein